MDPFFSAVELLPRRYEAAFRAQAAFAPEEIRRQEEICGEIFETVTADGQRPLAMVDTYGCQQNEADSEKIRGYLAEMGYGFTQDEFQADVIVVNTCAVALQATPRCASVWRGNTAGSAPQRRTGCAKAATPIP